MVEAAEAAVKAMTRAMEVVDEKKKLYDAAGANKSQAMMNELSADLCEALDRAKDAANLVMALEKKSAVAKKSASSSSASPAPVSDQAQRINERQCRTAIGFALIVTTHGSSYSFRKILCGFRRFQNMFHIVSETIMQFQKVSYHCSYSFRHVRAVSECFRTVSI